MVKTLPLILTLVCLLLVACRVPITQPRYDQATRAALDAEAWGKVGQLGRDGDWLVVRQYHASDDFVSNWRRAPLSHAAVLNATAKEVIESNGKRGVHRTPLREFIHDSHRIMLIRPRWSDELSGKAALKLAEALVGQSYDFAGLIGINIPDQFYCSELALAVYPESRRALGAEIHPVAPDQLYFWGRILYDSGAR